MATILFSALLLLGAALGSWPATADEAAAWAALRHGASVALMRHADAPGGVGDPPGFRLDDCSTQRNLSAAGGAEAQAAGERIRSERVHIAKLLSSPWCRCVDTAELMRLGPVQVEATFANAFVLSDRRASLTQGARDVIGSWKGPGTLLIVTHGANIQALIGYNPAPAEIVVVAAAADGAVREIGRLQLSGR